MYCREIGWGVDWDYRDQGCVRTCEHGHEPSVSLNCLEYIEWLNTFWLLKKTAPWSSSFYP
jgi:hypothetical protein